MTFINKLPRQIADKFTELRLLTSKLQKKAASIGFINKCIRNDIIPTFAKLKGQFIKDDDKFKAEKRLLLAHIIQHKTELKELCRLRENSRSKLEETCGGKTWLYKFVMDRVTISLTKSNTTSLATKNKKIAYMLRTKKKPNPVEYEVPIVNLSDFEVDTTELKKGLKYCFVDRNKYVKPNLAAEFEILAEKVDKAVLPQNKEIFHEFLRKQTDIFSANIQNTTDFTYKSLRSLISNPDVVVLSGDKDSSIVIMNRGDYEKKIDEMIREGETVGKYVEVQDTVHADLKRFQDFLQRHLGKHEKYHSFYPSSHQPARLFATAKTHKFESFDDITVENLKLRPIIDQTGTMTYDVSKYLADYLKPLAKNDYVINDTQEFPNTIKKIVLGPDEETVSYDVESLFTSIPLKDTIDHITKQIYEKGVLKPIIKSKLIFQRLLEKLVSDSVFSANNRLIKQLDGCPIEGTFSGIFSGIYMAKLENEVVKPSNPIFYQRYVDDIFNIRKKGTQDKLFEDLNKYHPNMKFTVETNPKRFLDTELLWSETGHCTTKVFQKENKLPNSWHSKVPKRYKRNTIKTDLYRAKRISSDFQNELDIIKKKYLKANFPIRFINSVIRDFNEPEEEMIIPHFLFNEKITIFIKIPFCEKKRKNNFKLYQHF